MMHPSKSHYLLTMTAMHLADQLRRRKGRITAALDKQGRTMLHWLIMANRLDLVALLVQAGIKLDRQDRRGRTALHFSRSQEAVNLLVQAGVNPNVRDLAGRTALHMFVRKGRGEMVATLLRRGGDVHMKDASGRNALHHAAIKGDDTQVRSLLNDHGAYVDARDKDGRHPLYFSLMHGHLATTKALLDGGADLAKVDFKGTDWHAIVAFEQVSELDRYARSVSSPRSATWVPDPHASQRLVGRMRELVSDHKLPPWQQAQKLN